ncbi:MAG: metal ABC transporter substrate-binding protein [Spirochaetaceae bacterium]|nr:metal ABC transporter substrate-binding protein [Spirochaetaceae bacterium]
MKKLFAFIFALILIACGNRSQHPTIVTTIFPLYVMALNITDGSQWQIVNIAPEGHHHQLTPANLRAIEAASFIISNGIGEPFMERIQQLYPHIPVINAGFGIEAIPYTGTHHHDDDEDDDHDDHADELWLNEHFWLSVPLARLQVRNITEQLLRLDSANAEIYLANAVRYDAVLEHLHLILSDTFAPFYGRRIMTFHDAFPYFARDYGFEIIDTISHEADSEISPGRIIELVNLLKDNPDIVLFAERFYPSAAAQLIAREAGRELFELDSAISGGNDPINSYVAAMLFNRDVIARAMAAAY